MSKPKAVLISDVHYNINTLEVADKAMRSAINKANELNIPFIVAGDLHDTKANLRGECINRLKQTLETCETACYILRGNHDSINEKSEENSLSFLDSMDIFIINTPEYDGVHDIFLIPYNHDSNAVKKYIDAIPKGSILIMHQGVLDANAGHYIQDKSACPKEWFADHRVISGHYHERQDIKCGRPQKGCVGLWSYLGNPYSLNFAEANDIKGYSILNDDGTLEFVPLDLRKHRKLECTTEQLDLKLITLGEFEHRDIVWIRVCGTLEELTRITKKYVAKKLGMSQDFKLDLVPLDIRLGIDIKSTSTHPEVLDEIIGSLSNVSDEQKKRLKTIWKDLIE